MENRVITINRMYGSNGRLIAKELSQHLGIHYYDKELIQLASEKQNIPYDELVKVDEKRASRWRYPVDEAVQMEPQYRYNPMNDVLFDTQSQIIRELAARESCIIVGRCANHLLAGQVLRVFIYAPADYRVKVVMERLGREEKSARSLIKKMDRQRRYYYEYFTDQKWDDFSQYDLCINSSHFTRDQIVSMIAAL